MGIYLNPGMKWYFSIFNSLSAVWRMYAGSPKRIEEAVLEEVAETHGRAFCDFNKGLLYVMETIYRKSEGDNKGVIFIIDEWDCVFRITKENAILQEHGCMIEKFSKGE